MCYQQAFLNWLRETVKETNLGNAEDIIITRSMFLLEQNQNYPVRIT